MEAESPESLRYELLVLLGGYENIPSEDDLKERGSCEEVGTTLLSIVEDEAVPLYKQVQGVAALRFFPSDEAKALMEKILLDPEGNALLRRSCAKAYGAAFGLKAVDVLASLLQHPDVHTRDAAVQALAAIDTSEIEGVLLEHLDGETAPSVSATLKAVLAK